MDKDIKDYREKELKSFAIGNILLVLISSGLLDRIVTITDSENLWTAVNTVLASAFFSSVIYIFVFLTDSVVPGDIKDKIIWFIGGKPGGHIFTDIETRLKDDRFTKEIALKQYAEIYKEIKKTDDPKRIQNSAWYGVYKTHEKHAQVCVSQRDFLLCRDICTMTPLILIGYLCLQWYRHHSLSYVLMGILIMEFIVMWFIARSKGKRFAYNVIAIDIAQNRKVEDKPEIIMPKK